MTTDDGSPRPGPQETPLHPEDGFPSMGTHAAYVPPFHRTHPKVSTRLSVDERRRLNRMLRRRQQSLRQFLYDAVLTAESQLANDGIRWRGDVPEIYAWMAMQMCQVKVDEWEQLAAAAKAAQEPLDVAAYHKAWGSWQDGLAFFEGIVKDYRRRHSALESASSGSAAADHTTR